MGVGSNGEGEMGRVRWGGGQQGRRDRDGVWFGLVCVV